MLACVSPTSQMDQSEETQNVYQTPSTTSSSAPKYGTMIPSRIFVGGIDFKVRNCLSVIFLVKTYKGLNFKRFVLDYRRGPSWFLLKIWLSSWCAHYSWSCGSFQGVSRHFQNFPPDFVCYRVFAWICEWFFAALGPVCCLTLTKRIESFVISMRFLFLQFFSIV